MIAARRQLSEEQPAQARRAAFTLLEVLLATAIFAIVLLSIQTVFFAGLKLQRTTTAALDQSLPIQQALSLMRRDLQNTVTPGGVLAGNFRVGGPLSSLNSGSGTVTGTGNAAASSQSSATGGASSLGAGSTSDAGGLDFFTATGVVRDYEPGADIQEVNYLLQEPLEKTDKTWGQDLVRRVTRNLLSFSTPEPEEQRLLHNVESLEFEFHDGMDWRETWDTSVEGTPLPMAVRVKLLMAEDPEQPVGVREPIKLVVQLNSQSTTNATEALDTGTAETAQ